MVKQGTGVSTDWKQEIHNLQTKNNAMRIRLDKQESIIGSWKEIARKFQNICRKTGWGLLLLGGFMCLFDFFAAFLHGTRWSFRFQMGFGLNQVVVIAISSLVGLSLLIMGYKGKK